jgi:hypothetical protein
MSSGYIIDQAKWAKLDIFNQMGNIYSEVGRSFKTLSQPDQKLHTEAMSRAIDLFDATIQALTAEKSARAKEVLRAKEQFMAIMSEDNASQESINSLDRYFLQFAIAARLNR